MHPDEHVPGFPLTPAATADTFDRLDVGFARLESALHALPDDDPRKAPGLARLPALRARADDLASEYAVAMQEGMSVPPSVD
jgi:hypothetical protein